MTKNKKKQIYCFEQSDIIWIDDKYFRVKKLEGSTFVFNCCVSNKYNKIVKKYFCTPRHFDFHASSIVTEIFHQNLESLIWDSLEELPSIHKNSKYINASIPYSFKGIENSQDKYAFYHSFCSKRTLKKYLNILEEIKFLKIGKTKNGYIEIYDIALKECVEAIKEFDNEDRCVV